MIANISNLNLTRNGTDGARAEEYHAITWDKILVAAVLYTITLTTFFGNVLVLIAVKINKKLQTTFNYYIVNLAITDIAVAVTAMSFQATHTVLGYWPFGEILCAVWIFFDYGMTFISVFTLILISLDRVWSVTWSIHYRQNHTKKKSLIAIILAWTFMLLLWFPPWIVDRVRYSEPNICYWDPSKNTEFVYIVAVLGHHVPFLLMVISYTHVFRFMRKRVQVGDVSFARNTRLPASSSSNFTVTTALSSAFSKTDEKNQKVVKVKPAVPDIDNTSNPFNNTWTGIQKVLPVATEVQNPTDNQSEQRFRKERKVFITLTYIIVAYGILWLPFHIIFDISIVNPVLVPEEVLNLAFWMAYVNSTVNPLLYNFSSAEFRKTFKKILLTMLCKGN